VSERYQKYLQSDHWKKLKASKQSKTKKRCAVCGSDQRIELHHLTYGSWFDVDTADLRWMCRRCHGLAHELMKRGEIKYKSASNHHRFAVTVIGIKRALGVKLTVPFYGKGF
jgi:hypothetical protein